MFGFLSASAQTLITFPWEILPPFLCMWQKLVCTQATGVSLRGVFCSGKLQQNSKRQLGCAGSPSSGQQTQPSPGSSRARRTQGAEMRWPRPSCHPDPFPSLITQLLPPRYCPQHPATDCRFPRARRLAGVPLSSPLLSDGGGWRSQWVDWAGQGAGGWRMARTSASNSVTPTKNI